jgi:hypothetical protein
MDNHVLKMVIVLLPFPSTKRTLTSSNLQRVMVKNGSLPIKVRSTRKAFKQTAGLRALQCRRKDIRLNGTTVLNVKKTPGSLSQTMLTQSKMVTFFMEKTVGMGAVAMLQISCQFTTALTSLLG